MISTLLLAGCSNNTNSKSKEKVYVKDKLEKYDDKNNLVETTTYTYNDVGIIASTITKDPKGNVVTKSNSTFFDDGKLKERKFEYIITEYEDEPKTSLEQYDEEGNRISAKDYDNKGKLINEISAYKEQKDDKGNVTKRTYYYDNEITQQDECKYDDNVHIISLITTLGDVTKLKYTYKNSYDKKNNLVKMVRFSDGTKFEEYEYKYDKNGNVSEEKDKHFSSEGLEYEFTYKYTYKQIELTLSQKEYFDKMN